MISFDEFQKMEIKTAKIIKAEDIPGKDKLFKLEVDVGEESNRTLVAGLKPQYSAADLKGKAIIVVTNLAPAKIAGVESNGMLLAVDIGSDTSFLTTDKEVPPGSKIC